MGSGKVKKMIEVQKKAGAAPDRTGTWVAWVDSCVIRSPLAVWGQGDTWTCGLHAIGLCTHAAKEELEFYAVQQRPCAIDGGAAIKKERERARERTHVCVCV